MLAGEEGTLTLPDSTNLTPLFQNLLTESEIIATTLLVNYEADMARVLIQLIREQFDEDEIPSRYRQLLHLENVKRTDIWELLKDINYFVDESEKAIDTFFINITQQQSSESESTTCIALLVGSTVKSLILEIGCNKFRLETMVLISKSEGTNSLTY